MAKDELQRLIREQGSISRMAGAAEVSASTIRYWLKRWELKSCGESIKPGCKNCGAVVKRRPNIILLVRLSASVQKECTA
jgi:transposase-like protein